ncbi:DUF1810 domain-containing protein [Sphingomonas montanisoli]|uniref:DUF1810 domain-containing protein n=1 Tax=Sphingomonas montanisoli TaxID=2606412 RepID=A0A5D9C2W1_9SPHN|nr:DUF1810 domain-containing protein [Sphingomonas montanisoli]TZG25783.1 DUF1810 domain-containing protein [Sphingomonas montanisoli]
MRETADPHDLNRFVAAQAGTFDQDLAEVEAGAKRGHWMWFVFPQIAGLGHSLTARHFAIRLLAEARAYLKHPILGDRLRACVAALERIGKADAEAVFGPIDALKLRSSLTLFVAAGGGPAFVDVLTRWGGGPDPATLRLVEADA